MKKKLQNNKEPVQSIAIRPIMTKSITIQSMCDTKTYDIAKTVAQILKLEREGCDLVRVSVPDEASAKALKEIKKRIHIPLVADIHFDPRMALLAIDNGADKIRINPGNIVKNLKNEDEVRILKQIIAAAKKAKTPIRIGVNSGSLEKHLLDKHGGPTAKALVASAMNWVKFFESQNFKNLVISIKSTDVQITIAANELLFKRLKSHATKTGGRPYPIHLGVTEAGPLISGAVRNSVALGTLLRKGIGNTIRISLTEDPILELKVAKELLKSLGLYDKEPYIISCPTCARTEIALKPLVQKVTTELEKLRIQKPLKIAIMGCVVNGPGEAREADFALFGGKKIGAIYAHGKFIKSVVEKDLVKEFIKVIKAELK
ncbi:MAG TPA: flavodoxin-dependent (E)-4-hydroxy-3-methylbut-2-enyl-diphosphate synthase [Candidatus Gracilibacteria bacterium]|nr:flavodoxin-dependent (E)-4-hydroxy-3-methylbut-2-enyl-diphosphate synthase [Candidatus Gracilibacteria bacterium]